MKSIDEINREWLAGGTSAVQSIAELLPHFAQLGVEAVLVRVPPNLQNHVVAFAKKQDFELIIGEAQADGQDTAPWIALRDWVKRGTPTNVL